MDIPTPLTNDITTQDGVPSRKSLAKKINEIIVFLNFLESDTNEEVLEPEEDAQEETAESPVVLDPFEGWTPVNNNPQAAFFMPPPGYHDAAGNPVVGMVPRSEVPAAVSAHFTV